MGMVTLYIEGEKRQYDDKATYEVVAKDFDSKDNPICLVYEGKKLRELIKTVSDGAKISFVRKKDVAGHKTYVRTSILLTVKAAHDVLDKDINKQLKCEFAIADGYYFSPKNFKVDADFVTKLKKRMQELVDADIKIKKKSYPVAEARELFKECGMKDKDELFRFRRSSSVNVYDLDGYKDYYYGYMLPSTGYIKYFDITPYKDGFMLLLPARTEPTVVKTFEPREKLFGALETATEWGSKLGIDTVGDLNTKICEGKISDIIMIQEALQERRIGEIAKEIAERGGVKFVMIAGPSSSGKTSFSHRLSIQLATYGLKPHPIGVDDYFVNREDTPKDENGDYNFECLEAIDVEQFNKDMSALLRGERVELPTFNFKAGKREYKGNFKQLGPDDVLVIEGIHGLNPKMSYSLPDESKYKIYISALTSINIDEHNRIPTTDGRLLRRMVRDARTRGTNAQTTISMWPSVRRGEEENIFPFQENADAMFNSILIYELAAFKTYAEPLLFDIPEGTPEYYEAKRLLRFLEYFVAIDPKVVPINSICREFIGGSYFNV
jgi:uridine kinase